MKDVNSLTAKEKSFCSMQLKQLYDLAWDQYSEGTRGGFRLAHDLAHEGIELAKKKGCRAIEKKFKDLLGMATSEWVKKR